MLEGALLPREDNGPHAIFDGEVGYDGYQHLVGEAAAEFHVHRRLLQFCLDPPLLVGRLILHLTAGGDSRQR